MYYVFVYNIVLNTFRGRDLHMFIDGPFCYDSEENSLWWFTGARECMWKKGGLLF